MTQKYFLCSLSLDPMIGSFRPFKRSPIVSHFQDMREVGLLQLFYRGLAALIITSVLLLAFFR